MILGFHSRKEDGTTTYLKTPEKYFRVHKADKKPLVYLSGFHGVHDLSYLLFLMLVTNHTRIYRCIYLGETEKETDFNKSIKDCTLNLMFASSLRIPLYSIPQSSLKYTSKPFDYTVNIREHFKESNKPLYDVYFKSLPLHLKVLEVVAKFLVNLINKYRLFSKYTS